jgi:2-dehydro-3-deoxyphosphooctonate aldolase (KDO 8-P synthase)
MQYTTSKVKGESNDKRGTSFGYNNLVVDMRSFPIMRQYTPLVFDVFHSAQCPDVLGGSSDGSNMILLNEVEPFIENIFTISNFIQ